MPVILSVNPPGLSKIVSIGTALPRYRHRQRDILQFMLNVYQPQGKDKHRMKLLYEHSGIDSRYAVIPDYSLPVEKYVFYPRTPDLEPFPALEQRMQWYHQHATRLSVQAIENCIDGRISKNEISCFITTSSTGMSAPGLDISVMQQMGLPVHIQRSSVNFMGCYAALHALKLADAICRTNGQAKVLIVCTELCTLHFQKVYEMDNIASSLLFADGAAAALVAGRDFPGKGLTMSSFYSEVVLQGKTDMTWELSGRGFLMRLSAYIPQLIKAGISGLFRKALQAGGISKGSITRWAIHPGGKKILEVIERELELQPGDLAPSYHVLRKYGNMSSPTILFVLKEIMQQLDGNKERIFAAAFGPGLTMETLILES